MKFATPLTLALVITSRIGSADADAERTSANGLIDLEVGWNEKEHLSFPVERRLNDPPSICAVGPDSDLLNDETEFMGYNWELSGGAVLKNQYIKVDGFSQTCGLDAGSCPAPIAKTLQTFQRPVRVSVDMRLGPDVSSETVLMSVFPSEACLAAQSEAARTVCGFVSGIGGWGEDKFFGAGVEFGSALSRGNFKTIDATVWNKVTIELLEDGTNRFYHNDDFQYEIFDPSTSEYGGSPNNGVIAFYSVATGLYKNLVVQCPLPYLEDEGGDGCTVANQCHKCAGDCDADKDCMPGLKCFMRRVSTSFVPGCASGGVADIDNHDYCYDPADVPTEPKALKSLGDYVCTKDSPCGVCTGDCATDEGCNAGLKCFFRFAGSLEPVPGCDSGGRADSPGNDYCYDPFWDSPTKSPTDSPTKSPTDSPTDSPTKSPTDSPIKSPTDSPTKSPTDSPTDSPTKSPTNAPTHTPTDSPTPAIKSWALELTSVNTDFDKGSGDEITLNYKIGKNRQPRVTLHKTGCKEDISNITMNTKEVITNGDDPSTSNFEVSLDIEKSSIATSNIWDSTDKAVKLCVMVALISTTTNDVIKKLERNIEVALNFENNFQTIENATFAEISLDSNETVAAVENYIEACTCENRQSFVCNTNVLGVDDWLNVCIRSQNAEMEINYLDSLQMIQGENTLNIVSNKLLNDDSISSKTKVPNENGVHVASVIPASFFSYESSSTATVSGAVFLKLSGSRRRLAIEMDDPSAATSHARALQAASNQESAFSMEVQLEKNELEVADDSNNAIYAVMTGVIGGAAAVVTTVTLLMW